LNQKNYLDAIKVEIFKLSGFDISDITMEARTAWRPGRPRTRKNTGKLLKLCLLHIKIVIMSSFPRLSNYKKMLDYLKPS
jgi:hypothetical protein